ncbi:uncharacterized protein LOC122250801 isoform X2 [Penaeus japonicus]|uniref:uncharacterized protein LOC122250801 isoform X2 n=1 Tax=Penaeus japonicus TaxID=27405 RepID=UPI001C716FAF|nr:uncharacterized protein LOC122250801 isoform X2 [Penaeus japonicus]
MSALLRYIVVAIAALLIPPPPCANYSLRLDPRLGSSEVDEVIYDGLNLQWTTPGYPNNYEDGTNMSLSVMFPESQSMYIATIVFNGPARIAGTNCEDDYLLYTSYGLETRYCSDFSNTSIVEVEFNGDPRLITLKFVSSAADNATDIGFNMTLSAFDVSIKPFTRTK